MSLRRTLIFMVWTFGIIVVICHLVAAALNSPSTSQVWGKPLGYISNSASEWTSVAFGTVYIGLLGVHLSRTLMFHPLLPTSSVPYSRRPIPTHLWIFSALAFLSIVVPWLIQVVWTIQWVDSQNSLVAPPSPRYPRQNRPNQGGRLDQATRLQQQLYILHMCALFYIPLSWFFATTATQVTLDGLRKQLDYPVEPLCCTFCARWSFCQSWKDEDWREKDGPTPSRFGQLGFMYGGLTAPS
jgi:hypothetical protein